MASPGGIIIRQDAGLEDKYIAQSICLIEEIGAGECDAWLRQVDELRINTIGTQCLVLFDDGHLVVFHVTIAIDE